MWNFDIISTVTITSLQRVVRTRHVVTPSTDQVRCGYCLLVVACLALFVCDKKILIHLISKTYLIYSLILAFFHLRYWFFNQFGKFLKFSVGPQTKDFCILDLFLIYYFSEFCGTPYWYQGLSAQCRPPAQGTSGDNSGQLDAVLFSRMCSAVCGESCCWTLGWIMITGAGHTMGWKHSDTGDVVLKIWTSM